MRRMLETQIRVFFYAMEKLNQIRHREVARELQCSCEHVICKRLHVDSMNAVTVPLD